MVYFLSLSKKCALGGVTRFHTFKIFDLSVASFTFGILGSDWICSKKYNLQVAFFSTLLQFQTLRFASRIFHLGTSKYVCIFSLLVKQHWKFQKLHFFFLVRSRKQCKLEKLDFVDDRVCFYIFEFNFALCFRHMCRYFRLYLGRFNHTLVCPASKICAKVAVLSTHQEIPISPHFFVGVRPHDVPRGFSGGKTISPHVWFWKPWPGCPCRQKRERWKLDRWEFCWSSGASWSPRS